jgi:DNA ligase-1
LLQTHKGQFMELHRPMLAAKTTDADLRRITFPVLASPKIDGVRCLVERSGNRCHAYSRSMKLIPNKYIQEVLSELHFHGLDGELVVGSPTANNCMQVSMSGVMTHDGVPNFQFYVFDRWSLEAPYFERLASCEPINFHPRVVVLPHSRIESYEELLDFESRYTAMGYEGVMVRGFNNRYKQGRSTLREGGLLKVKRFLDSEAEVLDIEPLMRNNNPAKVNELGLTSRSTAADGKVADDLMGSLTVRDIHTGVVFDIGTGFTEADRIHIWNERKALKGSLVKYKHFPTGVKDRPRFPVFLGFRSKLDI